MRACACGHNHRYRFYTGFSPVVRKSHTCSFKKEATSLTPIASDYLQESRTGRNIRHHLVPLLRQSIYSRLAGYDDTNDAERLSQDPAMRVVVGWQGSDRNAARTNTMSRPDSFGILDFETETLTQEDNLKGLALMNPQWVELAMAHTPPTGE